MAVGRRQFSRARVILVLVGLIALVLACVGGVLRITHPSATRVGSNVLVNQPGVIDASNSPSIRRNPVRPQNLVATYRVDRPNFSAMLQSSFDGGRSWRPTPLPLPPGADRPFAPDLVFDPRGDLHVLYSNLVGRGNRPDNLWMATSADGGRTLSSPVLVAKGLTFQPRLVADSRGTVYATWLQASNTGNLSFVGEPPYVVAVRSTDGGTTFSTPVRVSDPERERVGAASPVIDGEGRLVVMYEDFKDDRRDFENLDGPPWDRPFALVLTTSTDGGRTFPAGTELEAGIVASRRFLPFLPDFPSLAAGAGRTLYASWADGRNGDDDAFLRRSDDGGRTWLPAVRVNDNPLHDGTVQNLPAVAVAPGGRVDVVFYDRRRDPTNVMTDVTLATSNDGGRSWKNTRLSDRSFDSRVGPVADARFTADFGSRLSLDSARKHIDAAWADTRFGNDTTGRQDVVFVEVGLTAHSFILSRWPVMIGLTALGLAALAGAWRRTGSRGPPGDDRSDAQPAPSL